MLRSAGVFVRIINTPKEAGQTCGISVRFQEQSLPLARHLFSKKPFRSFVGFFIVNQVGARLKVDRV